MNSIPMGELELHARLERERLHNSLFELRDRVQATVDPRTIVRSHLAAACLIVGLAGIAIGYLVAGQFTRK